MKYSKNKYILDLKDLNNLKEIYIYGTGISSKKFKNMIEEKDINVKILGFIDSYKKTKIIDDEKIYNINDFKEINKTIVICTYYEEWIDEIIQLLISRNINNYLINMIILDPIYNLNKDKYKFFEQKILFIKENLQNELDCKIWDAIINALRNNKNNLLLFDYYYFHGKEQYLDCIKIDKNDTVIEGGIFDGITTLKIAKHLINGKIYGFDPLISNEKEELFFNKKIEIIKKALWNNNKDLYFINNGAGSYVSENISSLEYIKVNAITIDNFIENHKLEKFDFLKLDVEGAELNVLIGAIESIKKFRPKLAISIYHSLEDFFEIPYYLMQELKEYNFNIRLYSGALMDTVLYAVPK